MSLADLLELGRRRLVTDARDIVFSLLGMLPIVAGTRKVDYTQSMVEVYTDVVVGEMRRTGRYHLTEGMGDESDWENRPVGLPSWVPDF